MLLGRLLCDQDTLLANKPGCAGSYSIDHMHAQVANLCLGHADCVCLRAKGVPAISLPRFEPRPLANQLR